MANTISYVIDVILIYFFTFFGARILSKKSVTEMGGNEIIGLIILGTVAAQPLVNKVMSETLLGIFILMALIFITSRLSQQNKLTRFFEHTPTVLIKNGKLDYRALKASNLSLNFFYGLLRNKGYSKTEDLEYAVLEPQGQLSVFPKSQKRPVQPADLKIATQYEGMAVPLVMDGNIMRDCLKFVNLTDTWLNDELKKQNINDLKSILIAELDTSGILYVTKKNDNSTLQDEFIKINR